MKPSWSIAIALKALAVSTVVSICLAFDWLGDLRPSWFGLGGVLAEAFATVHSPDLQWMVLACVSVYSLCFFWLDWKISLVRRDRVLFGAALLLLGVVSYARNYAAGSATTDALVVIFGLVLFGGIVFWHNLESNRARPFPIPAVLLGLVLSAFCLALLADKQTGQAFNYRGQHRWIGLWNNPNMSGVLMAAGLVLAVGWAVSSLKSKVESCSTAERGVRSAEQGWQEAESGKLKAEIGFWAGIVLLGIAAIICSIGLVKSYCRGAWLGAVCGLGYLLWQGFTHLTPAFSPRPTGGEGESPSVPSALHVSGCSVISRFKRNWLPVSAIVVSVLIIGFWNLRHTEHVPARRIASAANVNDFSSRNRVAGWEGALQMAAEQPLLGFGWNMQDQLYDEWYRQPRLDAFRAIRTNDYFKLANTLGIPALACLVAFVGLSLMRSAKGRTREKEIGADTSPRPSPQGGEGGLSLPLACRAGVVVLLVSFWFDGADSGLFRLASSSLFWMLLALGSVEEMVEGRGLRVESGGVKQPA